MLFHLYSPVNPEMSLWLAELQQENLKPCMEVLERLGDSRAEAEYQEVFWINKHAGRLLLNHQHNYKNLKRYKHRKKSLVVNLPAPLVERLESEADEFGMNLSAYISMRLSGYSPQLLPEV